MAKDLALGIEREISTSASIAHKQRSRKVKKNQKGKGEIMKILFLIDSLSRGGKERRMIELMKGLIRGKEVETVLVILSDKVEYEEVFDLDLPIHTIARKSKKDLTVISRLYHLCRRIKPDIIHSWGTLSGVYAIPAAKRLGIKLINGNITNASLNLKLTNKRFFLTRLTYPFADMIIGNSLAGLRAYRTPAAKSECVYNGFDFRRIRGLENPGAIRRRLKIRTEKVVGMVGAFHDRKDYKSYLEAAIQLLETREDITFLAIGDGPNRKPCEASVPAKFQNRILFPGLIQQVESVMQLFDVGVLSTNTKVHGEGVSNAIMEYMALSKPVVATHGGGTPEILLDQETGFLVEPFAPENMAEKIGFLLDHSEEAKQMGRRGRKRIEQEFSLPKMTENYLKLYRRLTAAPPGKRTDPDRYREGASKVRP